MTLGKLASVSTKIIVLTPMPGKSRSLCSGETALERKCRAWGQADSGLNASQFLYSDPQPWAGRRSASELCFPQVSTRDSNNCLKELSGRLSSSLFHRVGKMEHRSHCCPAPPNLGGLGVAWGSHELTERCPCGVLQGVRLILHLAWYLYLFQEWMFLWIHLVHFIRDFLTLICNGFTGSGALWGRTPSEQQALSQVHAPTFPNPERFLLLFLCVVCSHYTSAFSLPSCSVHRPQPLAFPSVLCASLLRWWLQAIHGQHPMWDYCLPT